MLAIIDVFGFSEIVSEKCTPSGLIITKVSLFSMEFKAMKGDYNQEFLSQKPSEHYLTSHS